MGAHVWWPWYLKEHWFGQFRLSGWSPDWYAGFPVGQYYFPLPAVLIALLDLIPFVSYNVAFKLVTVSGAAVAPRERVLVRRRACGRPGPHRPPSRSRRRGCSCRRGTTGRSTAATSRARSRASSRSRSRSRSACSCWARRARRSTPAGDPGCPRSLIAASAMSHVVVAMVLALFALVAVPHPPARGGRGVSRSRSVPSPSRSPRSGRCRSSPATT